jgi:hypothetical protein
MRCRFIALALLLSLLLSGVGPVAQADPGNAWLAGDNGYLENGDFEGSFSTRLDPYAGTWAGELEVADGWELWYDNNQVCPPYDPGCDTDSYNRRPEYKPEPATGRVHGGQRAQKFFTTYGTHTAGLYQSVSVPAGSWVRFSVWVWAWSSQKDVKDHSFQPGDYAMTVGIGPQGGTDWRAEEIVWRSALTLHDQWVYLEMDAYTESGEISVWTKGSQIWPVKHNDSYWDDARLVVLPAPPEPTPTETPTRTPQITPEATPDGYQPPLCSLSWSRLWEDAFEQSSLVGWGRDPAKGTIAAEDGALRLRNGARVWEAFPVAWLERIWPTKGDLRFSFRFAYSNHTGYGSTIGIGSEPYHGERMLAGAPSRVGKMWGLTLLDMLGGRALTTAPSTAETENILSVSHRSTAPNVGEFRINLMGTTVWTGTPGDSSWHSVQLELRENTYILHVDGAEVGRAVSYWRPQSFFVGNPVIVWIQSFWTEVALDDVTLEQCCSRTLLPILLRGHAFPQPDNTATATIAPSPSATASIEPTVTPSVTLKPSHTLTPTATATEGPTPTVTMP